MLSECHPPCDWCKMLNKNHNHIPVHSRRGLSLFDSILAFAVLSIMLLWGAQIIGNWISGRAIANEARSVADLAHAGRLLVEGDVNHTSRVHTVGTAPNSIAFTELANAGLRTTVLGTRSPGGRELSLHFYRPSTGVLLVIARARGTTEITRIPGVEDGVSSVGVLLEDEGDIGSTAHMLNGPGVYYDMKPINTLSNGFATKEDIFAIDYVALDIACNNYIYRVAVSSCVGANTMNVDLDMGSNNLINVGEFKTSSAEIEQLEGVTQSLEFDGNVKIEGNLVVQGDTELAGNLEVTGTFTAPSMTIEDDLTVQGDMTASGDITGANLTFNGEATVSGTASLGGLEITNLITDELRAETMDLGTGTFTEIIVNDMAVRTCTGCN